MTTQQRQDETRLPPQVKKTVIVFRKDLLPVSETFILDQVASYLGWRSVLLGFRLTSGIDVTKLRPALVASRSNPFTAIYLKVLQHGQYFGLTSRRLKTLIKRNAADLVHAHFGYDAILVSDVVGALKLPLCVTLHGTDLLTRAEVWKSGQKGRFFKRYPAKLAELFQQDNVHFICVSRALRQAALARGAPPARTHVFYTGIDLSRFPHQLADKNPGRVLFVGRLVEFKGCEYLVRAMRDVCAACPDASLTVVGDGPQRRMLEELAVELGVDVAFLGALPNAKVAECMLRSGILCLPSITDREGNFEAFGMVMLEAQACGMPVITSAPAGAEAIQVGVTGYVFPERDVSSMSRLLIRLIQDKATFKKMSFEARTHVARNFDVRSCTAQIERFYDRLT